MLPFNLVEISPSGIGRIGLVNLSALALVIHPVAMEDVNGREVSLDTVFPVISSGPGRLIACHVSLP